MKVIVASGKPEEGEDRIAIGRQCVNSLEELELALHLAESAFKKNKNIAKSLRFEFLLFLAGTRDIRSAMKKTAPGKKHLLVIFSDEGVGDGVDLRKKAEPLSLERISLSRV